MPQLKLWNYTIEVEYPEGMEIREGVSYDEYWKYMYADYGYIQGTISPADGEEIDVFVGPDPDSECVFIVSILKDPFYDLINRDEVAEGVSAVPNPEAVDE